jgi:hypothetical protein
VLAAAVPHEKFQLGRESSAMLLLAHGLQQQSCWLYAAFASSDQIPDGAAIGSHVCTTASVTNGIWALSA